MIAFLAKHESKSKNHINIIMIIFSEISETYFIELNNLSCNCIYWNATGLSLILSPFFARFGRSVSFASFRQAFNHRPLKNVALFPWENTQFRVFFSGGAKAKLEKLSAALKSFPPFDDSTKRAIIRTRHSHRTVGGAPFASINSVSSESH